MLARGGGVRAQWDTQVTYTTTCRVCQVGEVQTMTWWANMELPLPKRPDGWHVLNGDPICPAYRVEVTK